MDERREAERYPIVYPVEVVETPGDNHINLQDVSKSGGAFTSHEQVSQQDPIDLQLFLKKKMFKIKAMIVWQKQLKKNLYKIGVKFSSPPEEFQQLLEREVEDIIEYHRESNLYRHENLSFSKASQEYLGGFKP